MRHFITLCAYLLLAPLAWACPMLDHGDPRVGSSVSAPDHVTLHFTGKVKPASSRIAVLDAGGRNMATGEAYGADDSDEILSTRVAPLKPGRYKVSWHADCGCGSDMPGDYPFTVK